MKNSITGNATISIHATASAVWNALTNPELIKQYLSGTEAISEWKEGSPIIFKGEWEGKLYEDKGTILIVELNKLLKYNYWSSLSGREDKPEHYEVITYELFEEGGDTTMTVTQENIPDEKMKAHSVQNWRKILNGMKEIIEKNTPLSPIGGT
ncbi:MAG: SRPBCC domain-containing protein [Ferruginibacter sp.]|nr:SRPBCC domain-containing protein [Ferruginibacter sp.]